MNSYKVAIEVLKKRGWCKGTRHNRQTGESCLVGAFEHNAGTSVYAYFDDDDREAPILKAIILDRFPDRLGHDEFNAKLNRHDVGPEDAAIAVIACFNNHPVTKLEDVMSVLDEAAKQ